MITSTKSNFVNNTEDILNNVVTNNENVKVTSKEGNAILLCEEEYNRLLRYETLVKYGQE